MIRAEGEWAVVLPDEGGDRGGAPNPDIAREAESAVEARTITSEGVFGIITRQAIRRGTFGSVRDLVAAIRRFIDGWNERSTPFVWTKPADEILAKATRKTS